MQCQGQASTNSLVHPHGWRLAIACKNFSANREKRVIELVHPSIPDQESLIPIQANDLSFEIGDNEKLPRMAKGSY
ncbi:Hypothetical protein Minf_1011 [Methylacidiphilum infernorum V4]|uniref:Uncharacterized protein n=1 Tax=Methylacidiphilum infernorum (isolate V4) TaxID=481448 RepID=B3DUR3_METI4|nr:Hypothetical protein Minf_1011 [Methylacidiphilum infernorum V4]